MSNITIPLDIESLEVISQVIDTDGNIILDVESKKKETPCHKCGKPATILYGHSYVMTVEHTSIFDTPVYLRIKQVRYQCEHCNDHPTTTEKYDWIAQGGKITKALEDFILRHVIHSTIKDVARKLRISYKTICSVMNNRIGTEVDWSKYTNLHTLGIDEISNRKGHKNYWTIISARTKEGDLSVLAVLSSRKQTEVKKFLESIPEGLRKTVKSVCTDMHDGYISPVIEIFRRQVLVVDRYHVAKLYRKPLDKLRIKEMARLKDELPAEEYAKLEGMMWILRRKHECLTQADKDKLSLLYQYSPVLKKAHHYALKLTNIFNMHSKRKDALAKIERWVKSVKKSELTCFNSFIKTLKKYKGYIANYFKDRKNSGFVEGLNNKIKVAKRRCYGFFKTSSLFQRLFLDIQGYKMLAF